MSPRPIQPNPRHDACVGQYLARRGAARYVISRAHQHVPDNRLREAMWRARYSLIPIEATLP